jgi:hypothetical protein
MRTARKGAEALRDSLRAHGGTAAALLDDSALVELTDTPGPAQVAASGPRAAADPDEYELLMEMILEGVRLHYGPQRLVRTDDHDLALLVGDQLYALGLARLAALGDLDAVAELADMISLVAEAHADANDGLAAAVWEAGAVAIGWGESDQHAAAKRRARARERGAEQALLDCARIVR